MTEYDYSPEAYERYMAKQHSIANWVSKTNSYPPANPFVPTTPAVQAKSLQRDMTRSSGHSSHHSRSKSAKYDDRRDRDRDVKPRDRDWDRQYYSDRPSNSSPTAPYLPPSNSHSRPSHSRRSSNQTTRTPPSSRHHASASVSHLPPSNRDRPAASRSQTQIAIPPTGRQKLPTRSNTSPAVAYPAHGNQPYVHSGKQPLVVPIGGGQYVVVPPKGTRMEMMHQAKYPQYIPQPAPIPVPPPVMPSPTKQQPLLKRLFTGLTRGGSKQTSNGSGMFGKGRRGRRNSY
ncbi:hypothetical protein CCMSSC00406_0006781 [Pleurotus cornucopiae]|uniref:Uncharacterized protein n=1 Tax=Pleurotus cornucopiae TaxID=5321 RepID=A0ACB7J3G1_PLECO|nr:hypothetical protein CCMSSC00406_0006781 [Pleurotus cornucopiae]